MSDTNNRNADVLTIWVGTHFDARLSGVFTRACRRVQTARARKIVIDFSQTRRLHESGLALLMMLHDRAWCLPEGIELVNCSPAMRGWLSSELYPGTFKVA
jgi:anti-anti-sigma regulatory factor